MRFIPVACLLASLSSVPMSMIADAHSSTQEEAGAQSTGSSPNIEMKSVASLAPQGQEPPYAVSFSYRFAGKGPVFIKGVGKVPAEGTLTYVTPYKSIEVMAADKSTVLAILPLSETAISQGYEVDDYPAKNDVPSTYQIGTWSGAGSFPLAVLEVASKYFLFGAIAQQEGGINRYKTQYRTLDISDPQTRAQIALIVTQPYDEKGGRFVYHLTSVVRDRPRMSNTYRYGNEVDSGTQSAAQKFIDSFMADLTAMEKKP